jgi:large subunit ribosomal protein L15
MRGFNNYSFTTRFAAVNLDVLEALAGENSPIDRDRLVRAGIIRASEPQIKILGEGNLTKAITVVADKFSGSARQKIEAAGGSAVELASKE